MRLLPLKSTLNSRSENEFVTAKQPVALINHDAAGRVRCNPQQSNHGSITTAGTNTITIVEPWIHGREVKGAENCVTVKKKKLQI